MTQCCSGQFLVCLSSGAVLAGLLVAVERCFSSSRELVWMAGEGDRNKNLGKEQLKCFSVVSHFCVMYTLVWFFFSLLCFHFCLFISETPFHFTLPKEGDIIPPLTGATPPYIGHLKLDPNRHSTPIGE